MKTTYEIVTPEETARTTGFPTDAFTVYAFWRVGGWPCSEVHGSYPTRDAAEAGIRQAQEWDARGL